MAENEELEQVDIVSVVSNIQKAEIQEEQPDENFEESEDFDQDAPLNEEEEEQEEIPKMSKSEYMDLSNGIVNTLDSLFVSFADNKVLFNRYLKDIAASDLVQCEKLYDQEESYKAGEGSFTYPTGKIADTYASYKSYRKKVEALKLSKTEQRQLAKPLSRVLQEKVTEMSPSTSLLIAVGLVYGPRSVTLV